MPACRIISYSQPIPYSEALEWQYALAARRLIGEIPDTLLLLEHPPTITLGRGTNETDLLTDEVELEKRGIQIERVDRGGEITYHGPGQLVGYPILDLRDHGQDLHRYLRDLEQVIIDTLMTFRVSSERVPGRTGVWVSDAKIAAIGIKVSRWISLHGFALNITTNLTPFRQDFVPCGIRDKDVISLQEILDEKCPDRDTVQAALIAAFAQVFHVTPALENPVGIIRP